MKRLLLSGLFLSATALSAIGTSSASEPYPMDYWAVRDAMSDVAVTPDGERVSFMKISSKKGNPIIEIYEADDFSKEPYRVGAKNMEITGYDWVSDNDMIVSFRDRVSKKIKGFNQGAYKSKIAHFNMRNKKFTELNKEDTTNGEFKNTNLVNILPDEPDHILVSIFEFGEGKAFSPADYYKLNLKNGSKSLVLKGNSKYRNIRFDSKGNPRLAVSRGSGDLVYYYRKPGDSSWKEFYRADKNSFEEFSYGGFVEGDDSRIYAIANNGHDRKGLWKYNLETKTFEELIFRADKVDVWNTIRHSNRLANPSEVTGVSYYKDKLHRKYFDRSEEQVMKQFEQAIPGDDYVSIPSRSKDGNVMVVSNAGPRDPGTFYLFNDGQFSKLGSVNGLLERDKLADVEYITYPARDGKMIPGFVTKPNGTGPFPLVVMPHGGPFIAETILYDEWAQMLANNGYMVLQPQYRGSQNYGIDFYTTAFINGGEGGKKMQDDKDDGALYLASKGLVDKDKMAMFGWSYGGYAALIAGARPNNIYQCVIAGAAVADNNQQLNYYRDEIEGAGAQATEQIRFWSDSVNPIDVAANVNVPMFVIHGSIDQRVPPKHAKRYVDKLKDAGIPHKYMELKNADHFSNTLFYDHKIKMYPAIIDFLKNDCGM